MKNNKKNKLKLDNVQEITLKDAQDINGGGWFAVFLRVAGLGAGIGAGILVHECAYS